MTEANKLGLLRAAGAGAPAGTGSGSGEAGGGLPLVSKVRALAEGEGPAKR